MIHDGTIHVAIVEDDSEIRQTLALIIEGTPGFVCRHTYNDCETAIKDLPEQYNNVVLMDINLPGKSGIDGVRILKEKGFEADFIMLTVQSDDDSIFDSLCAGAAGYLLKDTPPVELLQSIREVAEGGSPMSASIARRVITSFRSTAKNPLSEREREILQLLCDGNNYKVIAEKLFVSGHTVRAHIKNIYKKLQVNSRAEAVSKALKDKLV